MDKIRNRFMRLPVKLTEDELAKKHSELVDWTRVRSEGEHRLEARLAEMKEEKKQLEAEVLSAAGYANRAADVIEAREERRDVEVTDYFDGGNIVTKRNDTDEIVATRPADETERQMLLPQADIGTEEPQCVCESEEIAAIDCPLHGAEVKPSAGDGLDEDPEEEEGEGDDSLPI